MEELFCGLVRESREVKETRKVEKRKRNRRKK